MIGIACPPLSFEPFKVSFKKVVSHFNTWQILAEVKHSLPLIKNELREVLDSYDMNISVHAPYSDINIGSFNEGVREESIDQIIETAEICSDLGIGLIVIHPGHLSPISFGHEDRVLEKTAESLRLIEERTSNLNVTLALENLPRMSITICTTAEEVLRAIRGTSIKICFDIGHANTAGQIQDFFKHKELFAGVHLHDNHSKRDAHLTLGEGSIDFARAIHELKDVKCDLIIESRSIESAVRGKRYLEENLGLQNVSTL